MKVIIDRFEGDYAVVELDNRDMVDIPKKAIPEEAVEGDVLRIEIDNAEREKIEARIKDLAKGLWSE